MTEFESSQSIFERRKDASESSNDKFLNLRRCIFRKRKHSFMRRAKKERRGILRGVSLYGKVLFLPIDKNGVFPTGGAVFSPLCGGTPE